MVDGLPLGSHAEAEAALKAPLALGEDEQEMLGRIGAEWISRDDLAGDADIFVILPETPGGRRRATLDQLTRKGLLEWQNGMCRRR